MAFKRHVEDKERVASFHSWTWSTSLNDQGLWCLNVRHGGIFLSGFMSRRNATGCFLEGWWTSMLR